MLATGRLLSVCVGGSSVLMTGGMLWFARCSLVEEGVYPVSYNLTLRERWCWFIQLATTATSGHVFFVNLLQW